MRKSNTAWRSRAIVHLYFGLACALALAPGGCASGEKARGELNEGYASLDSQQYDDAIQRADAFLTHTPAGAGSAEALYLKGRALEQKPAANQNEARSNLQQARTAYIDALSRNPSPKLQAYIHTSLANVAYFQDDYATAASEWTTAYDGLEDPNVKAWALYRVGLCRQRMGQFADADPVFAAVQERFPNTVPAQRAKEKAGARAFSLQVATFANAAGADGAVGWLRKDGVNATKRIDPAGRSVVTIGPFQTYQQAADLKARYASRFPDAIIVP